MDRRMNIACWSRWGQEDWRLLDQDGLVKILSEPDWMHRVDRQGRNVAMSAVSQCGNGSMFDQLMIQAASEHALQSLFDHEDKQGVKFPAYAMRHGGWMKSASDTIWKGQIMHMSSLDLRNARGQGLFWQLGKLASATSYPWIWLPCADPLPISDPEFPIGRRTVEEWCDGAPARMIETYMANRLLTRIPGRPGSHASDAHALVDWFLPLCVSAGENGSFERWPPSMKLLGRIVGMLRELGQDNLAGGISMEHCRDRLLGALDPVWKDLAQLLPLAVRPERHVVKWALENLRMGSHWEGFLLANATRAASSEGAARRL